MAEYVDGFVIALPKKNVEAYKKMAQVACKVWLKHGALAYRECIGEDLNSKMGVPFPKLSKAKPNETVVFAWITYKSRAHRDRVNAKVMKDSEITNSCDPKNPPFDMKRLTYGGFTTLVSSK